MGTLWFLKSRGRISTIDLGKTRVEEPGSHWGSVHQIIGVFEEIEFLYIGIAIRDFPIGGLNHPFVRTHGRRSRRVGIRCFGVLGDERLTTAGIAIS